MMQGGFVESELPGTKLSNAVPPHPICFHSNQVHTEKHIRSHNQLVYRIHLEWAHIVIMKLEWHVNFQKRHAPNVTLLSDCTGFILSCKQEVLTFLCSN